MYRQEMFTGVPGIAEASPMRSGAAPRRTAGDADVIRFVQAALNRSMGISLAIDGVAGPATRSALREFQRRRGLVVDGIVGPRTLAALRGGGTGMPSAGASPSLAPAAARTAAPVTSTVIAGAHDRTSLTPRGVRIRMRDLAAVDAVVLHQMAFSRGCDVTRYDNVRAHFAVLPDGAILQLHPLEAHLPSSNGFNRRSVAVEFVGNLPDTRGVCWQPERFGCHQVTAAQIAGGRALLAALKRAMPWLRFVFAHRQSSPTRTNDPGPDIWSQVAEWAIASLELSDGGPDYRIDRGNAIPSAWRSWRRTSAAPTRESAWPLGAPSATADLSDTFFAQLKAMGARIGANPKEVLGVMMAESGIRPDAVNRRSGAVGLLQRLPRFLPSDGWHSGAAGFAALAAEAQLPFIEARLLRLRPFGLHNVARLYLANWLPAALRLLPVDAPPSTPIACRPAPWYALGSRRGVGGGRFDRFYAQALDADGDGCVTLGDLATRVYRQATGARWAEAVARLARA